MVAGALIGLIIGVALSVYVGFLDARKRADGVRARAQYRGSLVMVPVLFAVIGAAIGLGIAQLS